MEALTLLSNLRGPENAFAYANTLQNLPPSIRANIQAAMGRLPFTAQNPAQRGLFGDVGVGTGQPALPGALRAGMTPAQPWMGAATGQEMTRGASELGPGPFELQAGGRTAAAGGGPMAYLPAPQAAAPAGPAGQMAQGAAQQAYRQQAGPVGPGSGLEQMPTTYGPRTAPAVAAGMQAPSQWSPTAYNQTGDYARRLQLAAYENVGEDPREVMDQYRRSLPVATGPRVGQYRGV
jgi:hypothetical protein